VSDDIPQPPPAESDHPVPGFDLATAEFLNALALQLVSFQGFLEREGVQIQFRSSTEAKLDAARARIPDTSPDLKRRFDDLRSLFWKFHGQSRQNLMLLDEPRGKA